MREMGYQTVRVSRDPRGVLEIAINRPEVRNAFNEVVIEELAAVFAKDVGAPEVRAVVLRGEGPVFCAGGDLNWMKKAIHFDYAQNLEDTRRLAHLFGQLNECPKPVIGAVHGAVIGGGVGLASVCDIVIASKETQFSLSEVRLGVVPACIGPFVVAKIGASHARCLFMSAERIPAERAKEIGLVHEVVPDPRALGEAVERTVSRLLEAGPNALAVAKRLVLDLTWPERRAQFPDPLEYVAKTLSDVRVSPEGLEGARAFLEKRPPAWLKR